jgi:pentatricopeptide repeat protein
MLEEGVEPNEVTYNVLMHALCRMGRTELAYQHFHEMLERGLVPNKYTYTFLIDGNCKEGNWEEAIRLYYEMHQKGIHPDHCTHNALFNGFGEDHVHNTIQYMENVVLGV